jgi:uncharacterized protein
MSDYSPSGPLTPREPSNPEPAYYSPVPGEALDDPALFPPSFPPVLLPTSPPSSVAAPVASPPTTPAPPARILDPLPPPGTTYVQFFRTERNRWWKGIVVIALLVVGYLLISLATSFGAIAIDLATGRITGESLVQGRITITPALLLAVNLSAALTIPLAMLLQWGFYGQPVRWIHSVKGHIRWGLLGRVAVIVVPIWAIYLFSSIFLFPSPPSGPFTAEAIALLAVVLLTTPLQSAGEEYGTRGLIMRAAGSWAADPKIALLVGTGVSAVIFTLAHGAADLWLIAYYFVFGVCMSLVTWRTGGLETSTMIHAVNNVLFFGIAISFGQDLGAGLDRSAGVGGTFMLVPMILLVAVTAFLWWWAQRRAISRTN